MRVHRLALFFTSAAPGAFLLLPTHSPTTNLIAQFAQAHVRPRGFRRRQGCHPSSPPCPGLSGMKPPHLPICVAHASLVWWSRLCATRQHPTHRGYPNSTSQRSAWSVFSMPHVLREGAAVQRTGQHTILRKGAADRSGNANTVLHRVQDVA